MMIASPHISGAATGTRRWRETPRAHRTRGAAGSLWPFELRCAQADSAQTPDCGPQVFEHTACRGIAAGDGVA